MTNFTVQKTSFQWMTLVGIQSDDVQWMECMHGSLDLHLKANSERIEQIYVKALSSLLQSPDRVDIMNQATLN